MNEDNNLGKNALEIFNKADEGDATIIVPTIVLAEIIYLCEKKKVSINIKDALDKIKDSSNYIPYNLNLQILEKLSDIPNIHDMHDRIIIATAVMTNSILITKDGEIIKSGMVRTIW